MYSYIFLAANARGVKIQPTHFLIRTRANTHMFSPPSRKRALHKEGCCPKDIQKSRQKQCEFVCCLNLKN